MSTIRIIRTSEYINRMRDYKILIDGQQVGTIANGETMDFPTTDGLHMVSAKIDWCSSPEIPVDLTESKTRTLKVGSFKYGQIFMPIGLALIVLHFILSKFADFNYTLLLMVPLFLLMIYYMSIGRKKYLTLEEIKEN